jgi:hypothetical protein
MGSSIAIHFLQFGSIKLATLEESDEELCVSVSVGDFDCFDGAYT